MEKQDVQDLVIHEVDGSETQQMLRWHLYLQRLADGAWSDHIAIQGIANMLTFLYTF